MMSAGKYMALALAVLLPGCTMAPNYVRPESPAAQAWPDDLMPGGAALAQPSDKDAADMGWKTFFTDPSLSKLIQLALENNRDLRVSALNIERARGLYQVQRADLMPGIDATGESSNKGVSADLSNTGSRTVSRQNGLSVGMSSYELDFFGRIRSLKDNALETYLGTEEAYRSARLSLVSEVAQAYLALAADRERLSIASETLRSQKASYDMIERRHAVGVSSELDLRQAQTSVDTARVDIARYTGQVAQDITALGLMVGTEVTPDMLPAKSLSDLPVWPDLPVGLPSAVLLKRPDILQAEHTLKAANANIGAARANFFPRITLTAGIGTASNELSGLFGGGTGTWTFLPQISLPIFEGGRNLANLRVSETDKKIAVADYEKAIQSAFREVSDALIGRISLAGQLEAQKSLVFATSETYRLSTERYNQGVDSYLTVLDSQRSMYTSQLDLISVRVAREQNIITLYKVLGGGWKE